MKEKQVIRTATIFDARGHNARGIRTMMLFDKRRRPMPPAVKPAPSPTAKPAPLSLSQSSAQRAKVMQSISNPRQRSGENLRLYLSRLRVAAALMKP